jgi:putative hydrolase of the HAD superfamily
MPTMTDSSAIRCIAFDAAGTLIEPSPGIAQAYSLIGRRHGSRLATAEIETRFYESFAKHFGPSDANLATDETADKQRWRQTVCEVLHDVESVDDCFDELYRHFAKSEAWRVFDDVAPTIESLTDRGYQIVIASNFDQRLHAVCEQIPCLSGYPRVISTEVGFNKPAAPFFERIVEVSGVQPLQILMVGDDHTNDVNGALSSGLQAVWLNRDAAVAGSHDSIGSLLDLLDVLPDVN